ncbi:MAG: Rieske (2Fe-2S) protein [Micromonosporaceae bacterium]|nr:Rieske (2Fe-2S) protein [Micromonosporaceae bacterium]
MKTTRRAVLAGAGATGVALLAGCAVYGNEAANPPAAPAGGEPAGGNPGGGDPAGDGVLAQVSEIPVGGGTIRGDARVVITQPTAGTFACFSAVCTHLGCLVTDVSNGTINCACHGSRFNIADGSVASGPAVRPLPPVPITVDGDTIRRA